ncbi:TIGR01777 family oxidoreductase [Haemophilus pittmaniae]|uniref:TIGR01777 family oxidoreductase n=1 Tax=Haemophilus pittmaniae TaxID=249188 RepID=UPI0028DBD868|nr:TIGR01777 family oxidoreductase [Haemophilus pittmaniae]
MKILLTGGTGLVGRALTEKLLDRNDNVTILSRQEHKNKKGLTFVTRLTDNTCFDAVVNLAGEPIFAHRWTVQQKQRICNSRLELTRHLVEFINQSSTPPRLISGSACGFYGDRKDLLLTEQSSPADTFTGRLCQEWEKTALQAKSSVALLRTGIVLSSQGGALAAMLPFYRCALGGTVGGGQQYWSWIALEDMVNGILFLLDNPHLQGAFNFTAPTPVRNQEFNRQLAAQLHRPAILPAPAVALRLAFGERAAILLDSQRAIPQRLLEAGFQFRFSQLADYLSYELA